MPVVLPPISHYSYQPGSTDPVLQSIARLRLRLGDTDFSNTSIVPYSVAFSDEELLLFLQDNAGDAVFATCDALLAAAASASKLSVFANLMGGGSVDMRQMARELRETEKQMRERYINVPAFAVAEWATSDFNAREIIWHSIQRSQGS